MNGQARFVRQKWPAEQIRFFLNDDPVIVFLPIILYNECQRIFLDVDVDVHLHNLSDIHIMYS